METWSYFKMHLRSLLPLFVFFIIASAAYIFPPKIYNHDPLWHIALVTTSFQQIPFQMPNYAGAPLYGYNYLIDIIIWVFAQTGISPFIMYWGVLPVVYLIAAPFLMLSWGIKHSKEMTFIVPFLFFMFFGSSFSYMLIMYHTGTIFADMVLPTATQSFHILDNLPYAFALLFLFWILILLHDSRMSWRKTILIGFLLGISLAFKFYTGAILGCLLGIHEFIHLIKHTYVRPLRTFFLRGSIYGVFFTISLLLFYNPIAAAESGSTFIFQPFAHVHTIIEEKNLLYLPDMVNARYFLYEQGNFSLRLVAIELFSLLVFLTYNMGTRIIGIISLARKAIVRTFDHFEILYALLIMISAIFTLLFVQKGIWWNTIQFFALTLLFLNYFAARSVQSLLESRRFIAYIAIGIIVVLTLPSSIRSIKTMYDNMATIMQPDPLEPYIAGLRFLRDEPYGVVFGMTDLDYTSFVSAFAHKQTYYADEVQLLLMGVDFERRRYEHKYLHESSVDIRYIAADYYYLWKKKAETKSIINKFHQYPLLFHLIYEDDVVIIYERTGV